MQTSEPENPPSSNNGLSDDEILEMLVYAEQHGEHAALERFGIARWQLNQWRVMAGVRERSRLEPKADDGAHKQGGLLFDSWGPEEPQPQVIQANAESTPPTIALYRNKNEVVNDSVMRERTPGKPLTRAQIKYLALELLAGKSTKVLRERWRVGAGIMCAISQGKFRGLPRELAAQLKQRRKMQFVVIQPPAVQPQHPVQQLALPEDRAEPTERARLKELEEQNAALKQIVVKLMLQIENKTASSC